MKFIIRRSLIVHCKLSIPGTFFIGGGGVGGEGGRVWRKGVGRFLIEP